MAPSLFNPCCKAIGPANAKVMAVGEAPGEQEELTGIPFIGSAGQEFDRMLGEAGFLRSSIYLTNVLWTRPPQNKLEAFCVQKKDLPSGYGLPPLSSGKYLHPDLLPELDRLRSEIASVKPNLILALGNTACWAILGEVGISKIRGAVQATRDGRKVLPTYHPSAILRQWDNRPLVIADLIKARRECEFPEIRRPRRTLIINPSLTEIRDFVDEAVHAKLMAVDVETRNRQITTAGFAIRRDWGLVIPFVDLRKPGKSYWDDPKHEAWCWLQVQRLLASPARKIFQNGLYDIQYFRRVPLHIENPAEDTMLQHHAMYPEMLKGLGFLGSAYTDEASWKLLRQRSSDDLKGDDE